MALAMQGEDLSGTWGARAHALGVRVKHWAAEAAKPGSAGSLVLAACLGIAAFAAALASGPISSREAEAASPPPRPDLPLTDVSIAPHKMAPAGLLAPIGAAPPPAIDLALNFEVEYFWPTTPQTVAESVAIRDGPAPWAKTLRMARPGDRLRINGRVLDAPEGPWLRVRLPTGQDGYFAARTLDASVYRRRRAAQTTTADADPAGDALAEASGAPLMPTPPPDEGPDPDLSAPPSF